MLSENLMHAAQEEGKDADAGAPAAKRARTDAEALPGTHWVSLQALTLQTRQASMHAPQTSCINLCLRRLPLQALHTNRSNRSKADVCECPCLPSGEKCHFQKAPPILHAIAGKSPVFRLTKSNSLGPGGEAEAAGGGEAALLAGLMARERCLRDRNSQLLAPGKSFKRVLDVLAAAQVPWVTVQR